MHIILPLKLKWKVEDLDDRTTDFNLKILLPSTIVNVRNNLIHCILHVGTTNYNKQTGRSCILENKQHNRLQNPSHYDWLLLNVWGIDVKYDNKMWLTSIIFTSNCILQIKMSAFWIFGLFSSMFPLLVFQQWNLLQLFGHWLHK